jgi:hypothetical protein
LVREHDAERSGAIKAPLQRDTVKSRELHNPRRGMTGGCCPDHTCRSDERDYKKTEGGRRHRHRA